MELNLVKHLPKQLFVKYGEETGLYIVPEKSLGVLGEKDFHSQYPNGHQVEYSVFMLECVMEIHNGISGDRIVYKVNLDSETHLSILETRHAKDLYQLIDESRESIGKWLSFPEKTNKVEDTEIFIEKSLKRYSENNGYWAGIWHNGTIAGSIGFLYIDWSARKTEIGYWLGDQFLGKGLATKAVKQLIDHSFTELDLRKVEIGVASNNIKSRAIPERLGFTQEGTIRNYEFLQGEYHDRVIYGLLKEEWNSKI
ncbi:GNAT family N-acetyltransferase [Evansella sp. AB-rgal1]|uniref:GNAT family N-acetyltransferase n=1 Tax=Evansella sp. AB-rgal1 TaxID=3242696 RepID=UPI00359DE7DE